MKTCMSGALGAIEALMRETPNMDHRDDGCCGRFPECRNCAYHLPYSLRRDCMFDECPYVVKPAVVTVKGGKKNGCVPG
ncbi:MAG: hypothetical protein J6P72_00965 [Firmicutes bacterium]|nr:hypothetical protein [Bacillota bacterium]